MRYLAPCTFLSGLLLCTFPAVANAQDKAAPDPYAYDVLAYDLVLAVTPATQTLEGQATITLTDLAADATGLRFDLYDFYEVLAVQDAAGTALKFTRPAKKNWIDIQLPQGERPDELALRIHYRGQPEGGRFDGFHWAKTNSKPAKPWINTSCQGLGAHYWYPCKASYFHPEDKPERVSMSITCPADLSAVSNGRFLGEENSVPTWFDPQGAEFKTFRWRHDYPLETYSVTLNVGPYVHVHQDIDAPGIEGKLAFDYYVLPESVEKAALQFQQVPELIRIYSEAFGPFPFPDSKFALVETNFWGMEHSTAVAYGSTFPAWCKKTGAKDPRARRNRWFDYILVHEVAHEWWGNGVSAEHWGHFWIHEGLGTYAEGVYVEMTRSREDADRYFVETAQRIPGKSGRLYRGDHPKSGDAYSGLVYSKGACVMNTLRHYVDDDAAWWKTLRDFNLAYRYKNASTEDFRAVLEGNTQREWKRFFDEWVYGEGTPSLQGKISVRAKKIVIEVNNTRGTFRVPLDLVWKEAGVSHSRRLWIEPGVYTTSIACESAPEEIRVKNLARLLGKHDVTIPL